MAIPPLAAGAMKALLRLYPRSWRERYGPEMEVLLEQMPGELGVGLDLVVGAAGAYAAVIRGNRILSAAGAYLHGVCVAVLLQAIVFVTFILYSQGSASNPTYAAVGPIHLAVVTRPHLFGGLRELAPAVWIRTAAVDWLPGAALLVVLIAALALVLASPRLLKTLR